MANYKSFCGTEVQHIQGSQSHLCSSDTEIFEERNFGVLYGLEFDTWRVS